MGQRMDIVVQVSTLAEWKALLTLLPSDVIVRQAPSGAFVHHTWQHTPTLISGVLVHGGAGKIFAAASAQYAALVWQPRCMILLGTCGAVDPGLYELDLVRATRTIVHDIAIEAKVRELTVDLPPWPELSTPFPLHDGLIVSGDVAITADNVEDVRARFPALAADWESGAVAKVCAMNGVPCAVLKGVSDTPDGALDTQLQRYRANTPIVVERCWQVLNQWLAHGLPSFASL